MECFFLEAYLGSIVSLSIVTWSILCFSLEISNLQLSKNTLSAGGGNAGRVVVLGGVGDLAVVNDNGEAASSAVGVSPADQLAEGAVLVGHEQLAIELARSCLLIR